MKKLMKAKLMRKTCGEKWKVNESRLPRLIQVLREQDTLLELTLIKILFKISKTNRTRYFLCYPKCVEFTIKTQQRSTKSSQSVKYSKLDHSDPSKPSHRLTNGPKPSKTIESDGSNTKNH